MAPPGPFNPRRWLDDFNAVGGVCWFPRPDDMHVVFRTQWRTDDLEEARRLYNDVENAPDREDRWLQIEALVKSSPAMPPGATAH